jgi:hypothetical protein
MADQQTVKCRWPLSHISIDVYGNVRPCCAWELNDWQTANPTLQPFNINQLPLSAYPQSQFYQDLEQRMLNNQWASGCTDCIMEEQNHMEGTRHSGQKYQPKRSFHLEDMEIKFGNLCNQGCVMCSPMNSSLLEHESIQHNIRSHSIQPHRTRQQISGINNQPWYDNPERFQEVVEWASRCQEVKFRGGEPTVNGYLQKFLSQLSEITTDVSIFVNTNAHTFTDKLEQELKKFKQVRLELSIDGYGEINEFIRWPNKWSQLESNVDRMCAMSNTTVSVSSTVQLLNVGEMASLVEWTKQKPIWEMLVNVVWGPQMFRPCLANARRIDQYIEVATKHQSDRWNLQKIIGTLENKFDQSQTQRLLNEANQYLNQLLTIRGTDYKNIVPEL